MTYRWESVPWYPGSMYRQLGLLGQCYREVPKQLTDFHGEHIRAFTHPKMPSTPSKPCERVAPPMDWPVMTKPEAKVTVSVNSVPEKLPEP